MDLSCTTINLFLAVLMANIQKNPRYKCYFGCQEGGPLHHFPKPDTDKERFDVWKAVLDNDIKENGNTYIYNQLRFCNKHFEKYYISPSNRLTRNAIPTLNIIRGVSPCPSTSSDIVCSESAPTTVTVGSVPDTSQNFNSKSVTPELVNGVSPCPSTSSDIGCSESAPTTVTVGSVPDTSQNINSKSVTQELVNAHIKERNYLKEIERLNQKILKLKEKCKAQTKKIKAAKKLSASKPFTKIMETMPDTLKTFISMQLKSKQKARGRKFTREEKFMAASILKQSKESYNFLRNMIVLPSKRTLQRLLS